MQDTYRLRVDHHCTLQIEVTLILNLYLKCHDIPEPQHHIVQCKQVISSAHVEIHKLTIKLHWTLVDLKVWGLLAICFGQSRKWFATISILKSPTMKLTAKMHIFHRNNYLLKTYKEEVTSQACNTPCKKVVMILQG